MFQISFTQISAPLQPIPDGPKNIPKHVQKSSEQMSVGPGPTNVWADLGFSSGFLIYMFAGFGVRDHLQWLRIEISYKFHLVRPPDLKYELKM